MEVKVEQVTSWKRALRLARKTVGKEDSGKEPSDKWRARMLLSEHSPIRLVEYDISIEKVRQWVSVHLVRHHIGVEKFVRTQREDRTTLEVPRDELPQGSLNDMEMTCNAQALINISRKRLCYLSSKETRKAWRSVVKEIGKQDPVLAEKCVPECIYRGFCPEEKCCGYDSTEHYKKRLVKYRSVDHYKK